MIGLQALRHRFGYHAADTIDKDRHGSVRSACQHAAEVIDQVAPDGREKSTAVTKLEEAMMWGNAAIAREATLANRQAELDRETEDEGRSLHAIDEEQGRATTRGAGSA